MVPLLFHVRSHILYYGQSVQRHLSLVLYIIYYPPHLKYVSVSLDDSINNGVAPRTVKTSVKSDNWRLSIILSWVVFIHLYVIPLYSISQHTSQLAIPRLTDLSQSSSPSFSCSLHRHTLPPTPLTVIRKFKSGQRSWE